jgi:hypothetical protein
MPTFTNFKQWNQWQAKEVKAVVKLNQEIIEEAADEFKKRVEHKTPLGDPTLWKHKAPPGYTPGHLKDSWEIDKSFNKNAITQAIVYNTAVYAHVIEGGLHSKQAPQGMMRITIKELPDIIAKIARRKR